MGESTCKVSVTVPHCRAGTNALYVVRDIPSDNKFRELTTVNICRDEFVNFVVEGIYVCMYVYVCMYIYIYIYIYTHTGVTGGTDQTLGECSLC